VLMLQHAPIRVLLGIRSMPALAYCSTSISTARRPDNIHRQNALPSSVHAESIFFNVGLVCRIMLRLRLVTSKMRLLAMFVIITLGRITFARLDGNSYSRLRTSQAAGDIVSVR
jgi:formate/nitrite transporter FocA (FNT family)